MCTFSVVTKDWNDPFSPNFIPIPGWPLKPIDLTPNSVPANPVPNISVTPDLAKQMLDVLKRIDEIDKKLGRLDCILNDDKKEEYVKLLKKVARKKPKKKKRAKRTKKVAAPVLLTETANTGAWPSDYKYGGHLE